MSNHNQFIAKAEQLQEFLEYIACELGRISGFVQRQSKMTAACFVKTLILGWLHHPQASLQELAQVSAELGVPISAVGLHSRLNAAAVRLLEQLVKRSLVQLRERLAFPVGILEQFTQVNIVDSSVFQLPACLQDYFQGTKVQGGAATLKVQLSFDYLSGQCNAIELQAGRTPDQQCTFPSQWAHPGTLTLLDLGYFDQTVLQDIDAAEAFFVSRLHPQVGLYAQPDAAQALDLRAVLLAQAQTRGELTLYLGAQTRLKIRLVFAALPADKVEERHRQAKAAARRRGKTCSQRQLDLLAWGLWITNVPLDRLSGEQVTLLYRVRWQVELVFKLWKSQAKMDQIGARRVERVLCQFYARLLGVIIFQWLVSPYRFSGQSELSIPAAFRILQRYAIRLLAAIRNGWDEVAQMLYRIVQDFQRFATKNKRRKSFSTYQLLAQSATDSLT